MLLAGALTTGCGFLEEQYDAASAQYDAATSVYGTTEQRSNAYVAGCVNGLSPSVFRFAEQYLAWAPPTAAMLDDALSVSNVTRFEHCDSAIEAAEGSAEPVDAAALAYGAAKEDLLEVLSEVETYYNRGDYKDDRLARGIEMHESLVALLEAFDLADDGLRAALDDAGAEEQALALEEAISGNADFPTLVEASRAAAEDAFEALEDEDGRLILAVEHPRIDKDEFAARLQSFRSIWDEVRAQEAVEDADGIYFGWSSFVSAGESLVAAMSDLDRRLERPEPFTAEELEALTEPFSRIEGSPQGILDAYNDFVDAGNGLA